MAIFATFSVVLLTCLFVGLAAAAEKNTREALLKQLRERSSRDSPPLDKDLPVQVTAQIKLLGIESLCPKLYQVHMRSYEFYTWNDSRLAWSMNDHNVSYVSMHVRDIWVPSMGIWQNTGKNPTDDEANHVFIMSNGEVHFHGIALHEIACNSTAWEEYLKTAKGGSNMYKCAFVLGTYDYDMSVVDLAPPVSAPQMKSDANGAIDPSQMWKPTTASLQWYKPNGAYEAVSFEANRHEMPLPIGSIFTTWPIMELELVVKQKQPVNGDKKKQKVQEQDEDDEEETVTAANGDQVPLLQRNRRRFK